jgi:LysM repeat protein
LPGETLYGISKRHGLTVNQLLEINKNYISGVLKSGQTIQVPIGQVIASSKNETQSPQVRTETFVHVVQAGETKFGLSKKYNISIAELERLNPQIVKMLQTDQRLMVPKSVQGNLTEPKEVVVSQKVNTEPNPQPDTIAKPKEAEKKSVEILPTVNWYDYEVQPKETLFGIAKKSGTTIEELIAKNPQLSEGLKAGYVIKVPSNLEWNNQTLVKKSTLKTNSYSELLSRSNTRVSKTVTFISSKQTTSISDFEAYIKNSNSIESEIDFYKGALYAIDSLRKFNFEINVDFQDVSQLTIPSKKENKTLKSNIVINFSDLKVTPFVSDYCLKNNVPIVTRTPNENEKGNLNFIALPGKEEMNRVVFEFLSAEKANIIVVNEFESALNPLNGLAHFSDFQIIQTNDKGILDTDLLKSKLSKNLKNYVVLNSERVGTVLNTTTFLLQVSTVYPLQLVLLQPIDQFLNENYSANRFKALNTLYPVVNQSNPNEIKGFQNSYFKKYKTTPNENFISGFDITYDALIRLYQDLSFETLIKDYQTKGLMYQFWYKKNNDLNYSNHGVKIEQFSTSTD